MLNQHTIMFAGSFVGLIGVIAVGWGATYFLYQKAAKVQGF
jgi:hypothetical protein